MGRNYLTSDYEATAGSCFLPKNFRHSSSSTNILPNHKLHGKCRQITFFTFYRRAFPLLNVLLKVILPISGCWCIWVEITRETTICCVQICSKNTQWLNHGSIFHAEVALWHLIIHIYGPVCSSAGAKTLLNPQSHRLKLLVCNMSLERDITHKAAETISSLCGVTNLLINAVLSEQQFLKFIIIPVSCTLFVILLPPFLNLRSDRRTRHTLSVSPFT